MKISCKKWGTVDRKDVLLYEVSEEGFSFSVTDLGCILRSLCVEGSGGMNDVVLGYDTPEEYLLSQTYFGAVIGPIADRVKSGSFEMDGRMIRLPKNAGNDTLHSAEYGFNGYIWESEVLQDGVCFRRTFDYSELSDQLGELCVEVRYRLLKHKTLMIEYSAVPERRMPLSITNHTYFNLNGGKSSCIDHIISVNADRFACTDNASDPCCTGMESSVTGTPFDMRMPVRIADVIVRSDFDEVRKTGGIDTFFLTNGSGMREHASLMCSESGLIMHCISDAEGVLVYTGNGLEMHTGKHGIQYGHRWGCCFETEHFPNAVNVPDKRDCVLYDRSHPFHSRTEFSFERII